MIKGYPFEVTLSGSPSSAIHADQVKNLDWVALEATLKGLATPGKLAEKCRAYSIKYWEG